MMVTRLLLTAFLALFAGKAMAGDDALFNPIGFSQDGRYFAFEEYGIQDGSGFAYSSIYVIDTVTDRWVGDGPVRLQADSEERGLASVRAEAFASAAAIGDFGITQPGRIIALIGDGEIGEAGDRLRFGAPMNGYGHTAIGDNLLSLSIFAADASPTCEDIFPGEMRGFELILETQEGSQLLHQDSRVPGSRGCVVDYRLYGVVMPMVRRDHLQGVVIVSVYAFGFEGPDRRFIALPLPGN